MTEKHNVDVRIAELDIRLCCAYSHTKKICSDFLVETQDADMVLEISEQELEYEQKMSEVINPPMGYCEGIALYRKIADRMPEHSGFVFHGAAVNINGKGVIFTARSGVGKTTHISMLLKNYPENVNIINGDKPIIRRVDGEWRVFSTPWAGKEGMRTNSSAPLHAIVLLTRAEENSIEEISVKDAFDSILHQVYMPCEAGARMETFLLVDDMARNVKFYRLGCNMDISAAWTSYEALK